MDDKRRRLEILSKVARIPFLVHLRVGVRSALKLPVIEPEFFGSSPRGVSIKHAVMRDDALESIRVAKYPVGHLSAVARAQRPLAVFIDERVSLLRIIQPLHQILIRSAAPVAVDLV